MLEFSLYYPLKGWFCGKILCKFDFFMEYLGFKNSMVIQIFAGYSSLGWHLCSVKVCMTSAQDLLVFIAAVQLSGAFYHSDEFRGNLQ